MSTFEQQDIAALQMRLNKMEAKIEFLYKHLGVDSVEDTRLTDDPQVIAALRSGNMIQAISLYREKNKVGLADAKSAVEEMRTRLGI